MGRLGKIATASFAFWATASAALGSAVVDLSHHNIHDAVFKSGIPTLVEFYAPWCGHCKKLAPIYEELAESFKYAKQKVQIAKVDVEAEKSVGEEFGIKGFPTIRWYDGETQDKEGENYDDERNLLRMTRFITERTGLQPKVNAGVPSKVEMLTDTTFNKAVSGDKHALVSFTAPWCGHCKNLAPTWEKLAQTFANDDNILIGKVDCEAPNAKVVAEEADISSYPTIRFYPAGSGQGIDYPGQREEADFIQYINQQAGTHRVPGGGLDAIAGTIPSLDTIVSTLKTGGEEAYKNLESAAAALKDKYAEYYAKVAKKAEANAGYVDKELARLKGLLAKGGMAPEKMDDLTSRSNILHKFKGDVEEVVSAAEAVIKDEL